VIKWWSVKDLLPVHKSIVMVWNRDGHRLAECQHNQDGTVDWYKSDWDSCGCCGDFDSQGITHWMPLPDQPEKETDSRAK